MTAWTMPRQVQFTRGAAGATSNSSARVGTGKNVVDVDVAWLGPIAVG